MKKNYLLPLLAVIIFFNACSKSADNSFVSPPVVVYSTVIEKVYEIDTTKIAPFDTLSRRVFTYDNLNRLIKDSFTSIATYTPNVYFNVNKFEYAGTDTFVYRRTKRENTSVAFLSADTTYYKFTNGKYDSDTAVFDYGISAPKGMARNRFTYQPGLVIRDFQNWIPQWSATGTENHRIYLTAINNNITFQRDTVFSVYNGTPQSPQIFVTSATYLNNPNPFYSVTSCFSNGYFKQPGIGNLSDRNYAPRNLITQQTSSFGDVTYNYTFRSDGYPLSARVTSTVNGAVPKTKLLFVYKQ